MITRTHGSTYWNLSITCALVSEQGATITLLGLVSKIIKDNFIPVEEIQPDYQQITEQLFGLKSENEQAYTVLKETFSKVFNGAKIVVEQSGTRQ